MRALVVLAVVLMAAPAAGASGKRRLAVVKLRTTNDHPDARGRFTLLASSSSPTFVIRASHLPRTPDGKALGVWLAGPRPHFLGFAPPVGKDGRLEVEGPRTSDRERFSRWLRRTRYVLVTLESQEGQRQPGTTVLSGRLRRVERFDPEQPSGCFARASRDSNVTVPGPSRHPRRICRRLWRNGFVRKGVHEAPRLVVCVHQPEATPWVLPGGPGACKRVGLPVSRGPLRP